MHDSGLITLSIHVDSCMDSCGVLLLCPTLWANLDLMMMCLMFLYFLPTCGFPSQFTFFEFIALIFCLLHLWNTAVFLDLRYPYGYDDVFLYCLAPSIILILWLVCTWLTVLSPVLLCWHVCHSFTSYLAKEFVWMIERYHK